MNGAAFTALTGSQIMDYTTLAKTIRDHAEKLAEQEPRRDEDFTTSQLMLSLARMVEGKDVYGAFGAPGDWGYGTPIGKALREAYGC